MLDNDQDCYCNVLTQSDRKSFQSIT